MIVDLFNAIATDIALRLAAEGLPALADGAVLLGPENASPVAQSAAPRISLVPLGGTITKRVPTQPAALNSAAQTAMATQPWIWTDVQQWRVEVTGVQYAGGVASADLKANWDWTGAMMYVVIQSLSALLEGCWKPLRYEWADSKKGATVYGAFGRMLLLTFEVNVPVLLYNLPAPSAVAGPGLGLLGGSGEATVEIAPMGGSSDDTITIVIPKT